MEGIEIIKREMRLDIKSLGQTERAETKQGYKTVKRKLEERNEIKQIELK